MLEHVPSSPNKGTAPEWTSWETFFQEKFSKDNPFSCSFELSNPGALTFAQGEAMPGLQDVVWAQSPKAGTSAVILQALGVTAGDGKGRLSLSVAWLEEVLSKETVKAFTSGLERVIKLMMAENERLLSENATFGSAAALLP